ncbi:MAG: formyltetrahydrofolate deformylase [Phycisphaerales bacterium]|nr:formyltetrahydrofolate deformylase [Phycisphaerales bacterium]
MHGTLLFWCPDRPGIVSAVSGHLFENGCTILHADQYSDPETGLFYQRISFDSGEGADRDGLAEGFSNLASEQKLEWRLSWDDQPKRVALLVSRQDHCLWDLLLRHRWNELSCSIGCIISNHEEGRKAAEAFDVPFHLLPVSNENRSEQEAQIRNLLVEQRIELGVLARYMQVLTPEFIEHAPCPLINIHHSFLPAFSGARPYHQARKRGVKFVGATAHYVTSELDAGPIIAQDVISCSHLDSVEDLTCKGRDVERLVLARAVRWHLEDRILPGPGRVVVFE